jgi:putative membrane protein
MITDALLAYLHFISIILLFAVVSVMAVLLRQTVDAAAAARLARFDVAQGIFAVLVLVTGTLRVFMGAKGASFYVDNPVFWTKVGLFVAVGLLSIVPTMAFIHWAKQAKADSAFVVPEANRSRMRKLLMVEVHLLALAPLLAVLMARGIGR